MLLPAGQKHAGNTQDRPHVTAQLLCNAAQASNTQKQSQFGPAGSEPQAALVTADVGARPHAVKPKVGLSNVHDKSYDCSLVHSELRVVTQKLFALQVAHTKCMMHSCSHYSIESP
jgi:hypothetical protein